MTNMFSLKKSTKERKKILRKIIFFLYDLL